MDTVGESQNHILIVEDEDALREIVRALLEERKYLCTDVPNAKAALALLEKDPHAYDLVLSDIIMPEMNGLQFLERVRALYPDLPVVMLSALHDIRIALDAIRSGAYDYVVKPFEKDQLYLGVERALERHRLIEENRRYQLHLEDLVRQRTMALEAALQELERSYDVTLEALGSALDLKDAETEGHSKRVTAYTIAIARAMGVGPEQLKTIARGAYLHDIGKMAVPDSILRKPGPLTDDERKLMRTHCRRGYEILSRIHLLGEVAEIVLSHQEHYDGTGYPRGLRGEETHLGARIFAVADALDAMTWDRPYRSALSFDEARAEIERNRGKQFDPKVVDVFLSLPERLWQELRDRMGDEFSLSAAGWEQALAVGD